MIRATSSKSGFLHSLSTLRGSHRQCLCPYFPAYLVKVPAQPRMRRNAWFLLREIAKLRVAFCLLFSEAFPSLAQPVSLALRNLVGILEVLVSLEVHDHVQVYFTFEQGRAGLNVKNCDPLLQNLAYFFADAHVTAPVSVNLVLLDDVFLQSLENFPRVVLGSFIRLVLHDKARDHSFKLKSAAIDHRLNWRLLVANPDHLLRCRVHMSLTTRHYCKWIPHLLIHVAFRGRHHELMLVDFSSQRSNSPYP